MNCLLCGSKSKSSPKTTTTTPSGTSSFMTRYGVTVSTSGLSYSITNNSLFSHINTIRKQKRRKIKHNNNNINNSNNNNTDQPDDESKVKQQQEEKKDNDNTIHILKDVYMHAQPGELLAIMGPSGSGKSTLLNVLAGRTPRTAHRSGKVIFLGPPQGCDISCFSNYVMQRDVQLECLTVEETLQMSADLKLKNLTKKERIQKVHQVMSELSLLSCRHVSIGGDFKKGISGGQLKRVCIAVELLDDPSLLFLDEPTSGLDSALAFDILQTLMYLAKSGRTIICTVHQPRSQVFAMFDRLLLLSQGSVVYHGDANKITQYFERNGFPCPLRFNPADFVLDLLTAKASTTEVEVTTHNDNTSSTKSQLLSSRQDDTTQTAAVGGGGVSNVVGVGNSKGSSSRCSYTMESEVDVVMTPTVEQIIASDITKPDFDLPASSSTCDISTSAISLVNTNYPAAAHDVPPSCPYLCSVTVPSLLVVVGDERVVLTQQQINTFPGLFLESPEADSLFKSIAKHITCEQQQLGNGDGGGVGRVGRLHAVVITRSGCCCVRQNDSGNSSSTGERRLPTAYRTAGVCSVRDWLNAAFVIAKRTTTNSVRHPLTSFTIILVNGFLGLLLGSLWFDVGNTPYRDQGSSSGVVVVVPSPKTDVLNTVNNIMGALFFLVINVPFSSLNALSAFQSERYLFNRETSSRLYPETSFFVGKCLADMPFQLLPCCLLMLIFYWMASLTPTLVQFFVYMGIGVLNVFASVSFFYIVSALVPNIEMANLLAPALIVVFMLVSGFFLKDSAIPSWIGWIKYASWLRYGFFALAANEFPPDGFYGGHSNNVILTDWIMISDSRVWFNCVMLAVVGIVMRILAFFSLKYFNRRKGLES
eukprot:GHVS01058161.1.p1 GENE.GHVS01058161.1~~GHVS01058161.1.p1  ORF type:complete len:873 (+),score=134.71 GHVS01058161.1:132-2750(+)